VERAERLALHHRLLGLARGGDGVLGGDRDERVDGRIEPLDAVEHRVSQLDRR
jgi:hypothetical protein